MTFKSRCRRFAGAYQRFIDRQGFPIIMTACIAVIIFSAVWSGQMEETLPRPTPPVDHAQSAAYLQQQSLASVSTPTPSPTAVPVQWTSPLDTIIVLQGFDATRMHQSPVTGLWQLHGAADLHAGIGDPVHAMADGTVLDCRKDGLNGAEVTILHPENVTATYAGLAALAAIATGDPVKAGQTIGFAGNGMVDETHLDPHLHLQTTRNGQLIDPLLLIQP